MARALCVFRDSTHEKLAADQKIYRLAHHDTLTGLANRSSLNDRLRNAVIFSARESDQIAVLCLDLDGFKAVNDLFGHAAGDELLRQVAVRLLQSVREGDVVARMGGDEFVIVQAGATQAEIAGALGERILEALTDPFDLGEGVQAQVTVSIGIALFPDDGEDPATLLRNADTALYRAKWAGKCRSVFFEPGMDREIRDRRALESDLRHAIERRQLFLEWQPLARGESATEIDGFEVLLRWRHPNRGLIAPDVFIPIAEACGAIVEIGLWVLRQACEEAARWDKPFSVAVNVSPIQAQQGDAFATAVEQVLRSSGLDPFRLELEVTEGVLIRDAERVLDALRRLKAIGVRFALDDFGTGYSSLATLRAFPFDKIKIDRRFTLGQTSGDQDSAILRAVMGLARGLSLPVVAEGVETHSQLQALLAEGCQQVQGWYIGRPAPIAHFAQLLGRAVSVEAA